VSEVGDVASGKPVAGQDAGYDHIEHGGLVVHGTAGYSDHRDIADVGQHEHGAGKGGGAVRYLPTTRSPDTGRSPVVRVDRHAAGHYDHAGPFSEEVAVAVLECIGLAWRTLRLVLSQMAVAKPGAALAALFDTIVIRVNRFAT